MVPAHCCLEQYSIRKFATNFPCLINSIRTRERRNTVASIDQTAGLRLPLPPSIRKCVLTCQPPAVGGVRKFNFLIRKTLPSADRGKPSTMMSYCSYLFAPQRTYSPQINRRSLVVFHRVFFFSMISISHSYNSVTGQKAKFSTMGLWI